jgi:transglutaminase-like putative cysteine protease
VKYFYYLLIFLISAPVIAGKLPETFSLSPVPDWVKVQHAPVETGIDPEQRNGGTSYLLVDEQRNAISGHQYYKHYIDRIINQQGVKSGSTINFDYNPAFQKALFHLVRIKRDGQVVNKLDVNNIDIFRREKDLENQLYDGRLTVNIILEDIREGDVIEYSYTIVGRNPVIEGVSTGHFNTQWSVPVARQYRRLLWPAGRPVYFKYFARQIKPQVSHTNGINEYVWDEQNVPAILEEGNTPNWYDEYGWFQFAETDQWETVREKARKIYQISSADIDSVEDVINKIKAKTTDKRQQLEQAIHFVQDKVRYTGIEMGVNSFLPYPPALVLERRYGDCKDKTKLFLTILKGLGVSAYPVLANTNADNDLSRFIPAINLFDHMIAKVEIDDQMHWIDLTQSYQGRLLDTLYQPDYGYTLVVDDSRAGLEKMGTAEHHGKTVQVTETYDLSAGFDQATKYSIVSEYYGYRAESLRAYVAKSNKSSLEKTYVDYASRMHTDIKTTSEFRIEDDEVNNIFTVYEEYEISNLWEAGENDTGSLSIYQYEINDALEKPDSKDRRAPFKIKHPVHIEQTTHFIMPETWNIDEATNEIDKGPVYFKSHLQGSDKRVKLHSVYRSNRFHVLPEEMAEYVDDVNTMSDKIELYLYKNEDQTYFEIIGTLLQEFKPGYVLVFLSAPLALLAFLVFAFFYRSDNSWLKCWFRPRQTIVRECNNGSKITFIILICLLGLSSTMDNLVFGLPDKKFPIEWIWVGLIIIGPVSGVINVFLWGWFLSFTGRWLDGTANAWTLRRVVAWSNVPAIAGMLVYMALFFIMGNKLFYENTNILDEGYMFMSFFMGAFLILITIVMWRVVIHIGMIAEVQGFTIWRSIANIVVAFLMLAGVIILIVIIIMIPVGIASFLLKQPGMQNGIAGDYTEFENIQYVDTAASGKMTIQYIKAQAAISGLKNA